VNLERWTESELCGLKPEILISPTLIRFQSFDKREIPSFYYLPAPSRFTAPYPTLIYIHGGPESQILSNFQPLFQFFLDELGIAVLTPNIRGSLGYGKNYLLLDNGYLREDAIQDIGSLLEWIEKQIGTLDAKKIALMGQSYGGFAVLSSLVKYGHKIKCALETVGMSNIVSFLENTSEYRRDLRRQEYGDERDPKMREFLTRISPLTNVHQIKTPLLVGVGLNDPIVPPDESKRLVQSVRSNGVGVWFILAKDEGHGFAKKGNQTVWQQAAALFCQKHLLDSSTS